MHVYSRLRHPVIPILTSGLTLAMLIAAFFLYALSLLATWAVTYYSAYLVAMLVLVAVMLIAAVIIGRFLHQRSQVAQAESGAYLRSHNMLMLAIIGCALIIFLAYSTIVLPLTIEAYKDMNVTFPGLGLIMLEIMHVFPFNPHQPFGSLLLDSALIALFAKEFFICNASLRLRINTMLAFLLSLYTISTILVVQLTAIYWNLCLPYQWTP